jgi:hypothetical protein
MVRRGPLEVLSPRITGFPSTRRRFYRSCTANARVSRAKLQRSGPRSWVPSRAQKKGRPHHLRGSAKVASTLSCGPIYDFLTGKARASELKRSGGASRRVRAYAAPLHHRRSHPLAASARRALSDLNRGDRGVLGGAGRTLVDAQAATSHKRSDACGGALAAARIRAGVRPVRRASVSASCPTPRTEKESGMSASVRGQR